MATAMRTKSGGVWDRSAAADLFRNTLAHIPSVFGRLMYFNSLRDPHSGVYRHYGLATAFGRDQSAEALETSHGRVFREWIKLSLKDKQADLAAYLETLEDPKGLVVHYWLQSEGYTGCVPEAASKAERAHYLEDIRALLTIFSRSNGGELPGPKSSRRK